MQLNRFDLNLLIALDALLHEKNVTRAAERVFVSQPAMSAALHWLVTAIAGGMVLALVAVLALLVRDVRSRRGEEEEL